MRKILCTLLFVLLLVNISAQENSANDAFMAGDYSLAVKFYEIAIAASNDDAYKSMLSNKTQICEQLQVGMETVV